MLVDTDLLRMGAEFSRSAGTIAQRGATEFGSTQFSSGIFGDFDTAHSFHGALSAAHQVHVDTMAGHHAALDCLAEKAASAATTFYTADENLATYVSAAGSALPGH